MGKKAIHHSAARKGEPFIGNADDCEHWAIGNVHIHTGYRVNYNTPARCFWSLFQVHNETFNSWSHLLGAALFAAIFLYWHQNMMAPVVEYSLDLTAIADNNCTLKDVTATLERVPPHRGEPVFMHSYRNKDSFYAETFDTLVRWVTREITS